MPPKGTKRKPVASVTESGTATPQQPTLAEGLSYNHLHRPFKNPAYRKNVNRRSKNLKALLTQERERERAERETRRVAAGVSVAEEAGVMEVDREDGTVTSIRKKDGKGGKISWMDDADMPTYHSIEAPPSFMPLRHFCDITGLEAPYTDPTSGLRYHDKSVFELVRGLNPSAAKEHLMARGVNPIVK